MDRTSFSFAAVACSFLDFKMLDLSCYGIQGGLVKNSETEEFIRSISKKGDEDRNWQTIQEYTQLAEMGRSGTFHGDYEYMNLLWPLDFNDPPSDQDYFDLLETIRILHPSEFYLRNLIGVDCFESGKVEFTWNVTYESFHWHKYENRYKEYLLLTESDLQETNRMLAYVRENADKRDYIRNAIRYYSDSFRVNSVEMSFICLCICLETIVPGREQLSYRFRRNLAVLCSDAEDSGKGIYERAKKLYQYRSSLVHSGMSSKDFAKFDSFFKYAKLLASRMIIEMLIHDVDKIDNLDRILTCLGFGQKKMITENYKDYNGNSRNLFELAYFNFDD